MEANPQKRAKDGRFLKGNIANPGGRPAVAKDFRERCRKYAEAKDGGIAQLRLMAQNPESPHYFRANELLLAYAYGKPPQEVGLTGAGGVPLTLRVVYDSLKEEASK